MFRWLNIVLNSPLDTSRFPDGTNFSRLLVSALAHLVSKNSPTLILLSPLCSSARSTANKGPGMQGRTRFRNRLLPEPDGPERHTGRSSWKISLRLAGRTMFSFRDDSMRYVRL